MAEYEEAKKDFGLVVDLRMHDLKDTTTQHVANREITDVLVIVTGGTLTMVNTDSGYQP